ncbi:hypothetical protein J6590_088393 [Homalodisca vitripennis]|nr:hypothetical protein J6590_088393 [Homalodisca vitripennis]
MDYSELRMLKVVETPQQDGDRHLSFYKEIIPSISKFTEPQIVEFQLGVLQLVQKCNKPHHQHRASETRPTYLQQAVQQARPSPAESDLTQMDNMSPDDSDVPKMTENDDKWNKIYRIGVCSDVVCCSIKISSVRPIARPGSHPDRVTAA